jgi:hypothetical protein
MGTQASGKRGLQSSARKAASSRHGIEPQPRTRPVAGAFGREGADRRTPRTAGALKPRRGTPTRGGARRPVGISRQAPGSERREQRRLPPRGQRKGR